MPVAKVNGISINYTVEGRGEPLVMIMGIGGDKSAWKVNFENCSQRLWGIQHRRPQKGLCLLYTTPRGYQNVILGVGRAEYGQED